VSELVLHDAAGEFLLVHGTSDYLSLARRPDPSGEVPLVRFAPVHAPILAAALEAVMAEPDSGPLCVGAGSDELRIDVLDCAGRRAVRVSNLSRRRPGSVEAEALQLDRHVVAETIDALRGPRLAPLGLPRKSSFYQDEPGRGAAIETGGGDTTVSSRAERVWARALFPESLRRVVAACFAMVVGNPAESAIRVASIERARARVLIERVATSAGLPYILSNGRPGRPARPRRTVRLSAEMAMWVVRSLASDDDLIALPPGDLPSG
jgi:hypothetical protein